MSNKFRRLGNEVVMACCKIMFQHLLGETEETSEINSFWAHNRT
jgi:hypothetical protein